MNAIKPRTGLLYLIATHGPMQGNKLRELAMEKADVRYGTGAVYPALHSLEKNGLVRCKVGETSLRGGRPPIVYSITKAGRDLVAVHLEQVCALYEMSPR